MKLKKLTLYVADFEDTSVDRYEEIINFETDGFCHIEPVSEIKISDDIFEMSPLNRLENIDKASVWEETIKDN